MNYLVSNEKKLINIFKEIKAELPTCINLSWEVSHKPKTKAQLGFYFGGLIKAIKKHFYEIYGEQYDTDLIKEMLYNECSTLQELVCPNGKVIHTYKRISNMNTNDMSKFIERVIEFCELYEIVLQPELRYLWINNLNKRDVEIVENMCLPERNSDYLRYVGKETCLICGKYGVEVHHAKTRELAGLGKKTPDYMALPLCSHCHRYLNSGHITSETLTQLAPFIFNYLSLKQFCKMRYYRYLHHK